MERIGIKFKSLSVHDLVLKLVPMHRNFFERCRSKACLYPKANLQNKMMESQIFLMKRRRKEFVSDQEFVV